MRNPPAPAGWPPAPPPLPLVATFFSSRLPVLWFPLQGSPTRRRCNAVRSGVQPAAQGGGQLPARLVAQVMPELGFAAVRDHAEPTVPSGRRAVEHDPGPLAIHFAASAALADAPLQHQRVAVDDERLVIVLTAALRFQRPGQESDLQSGER